jgi:hypothetical protein
MEKKKWFWGLLGLLVVAVVYAAISGELTTQNDTTNKNTASQETTTSNQTPSFQKVSLADLPSLDNATLIQVQGTIVQKGEFTNTYSTGKTSTSTISYFLKITDGNAVALVLLKENTLASYDVGDVVQIQGANGALGDCSSSSDPQMAKICSEFALTSSDVRTIVPIALNEDETPITVITKAGNSSANTTSKASYTAPSHSTTPAVQPTIPLTYSQIMNGLSGTFTMGSFSNSNNQGYISDNSNLLAALSINTNGSKNSITGTSLTLFDPSVGYDPRLVSYPSDFSQYRTLHDQMLAQFLANIFPSWNDGVEWVNGAVSDCKQGGTEDSTTQNGVQISVGCSTSLGTYYVQVGGAK